MIHSQFLYPAPRLDQVAINAVLSATDASSDVLQLHCGLGFGDRDGVERRAGGARYLLAFDVDSARRILDAERALHLVTGRDCG